MRVLTFYVLAEGWGQMQSVLQKEGGLGVPEPRASPTSAPLAARGPVSPPVGGAVSSAQQGLAIPARYCAFFSFIHSIIPHSFLHPLIHSFIHSTSMLGAPAGCQALGLSQ